MSFNNELESALKDNSISSAERRILKRLDSAKYQKFLQSSGSEYKIAPTPGEGPDYDSSGADTPIKQFLFDNYNDRDESLQGERLYETVRKSFPNANALDIRDALTDMNINVSKETRSYPQKIEDEWVDRQKEIINEHDYGNDFIGGLNGNRPRIDIREWLYDKRNKGVYDSLMQGQDPGDFSIQTVNEYEPGRPGEGESGEYEIAFNYKYSAPTESTKDKEKDNGSDKAPSVQDYLDQSGFDPNMSFDDFETIGMSDSDQREFDQEEERIDKRLRNSSRINKDFELGPPPEIMLPKLSSIKKLKKDISQPKSPGLDPLKKYSLPTINDPNRKGVTRSRHKRIVARKEQRAIRKLGPSGNLYKPPKKSAFGQLKPNVKALGPSDPLYKRPKKSAFPKIYRNQPPKKSAFEKINQKKLGPSGSLYKPPEKSAFKPSSSGSPNFKTNKKKR